MSWLVTFVGQQHVPLLYAAPGGASAPGCGVTVAVFLQVRRCPAWKHPRPHTWPRRSTCHTFPHPLSLICDYASSYRLTLPASAHPPVRQGNVNSFTIEPKQASGATLVDSATPSFTGQVRPIYT